MKQLLDIPRTAMEVFNMLPEGTRCEVIDNTIYMSPSPIEEHQDVLGNIYSDLSVFVRKNGLGKTYIAPFDVYLNDEADVVQPDILFVKNENLNNIKRRGVFGAPDLVMEVLSSNSKYDMNVKFLLYQNSGVEQYIIVNPFTKDVWHYKLVEGKYEQTGKSEKGILRLGDLGVDITF